MRLFPLFLLMACTGDPDGETDTPSDTDTDGIDGGVRSVDLGGKTWVLDKSSVTFVAPEGFEQMLGPYFDGDLLVTITSVSGDQVEGLMARVAEPQGADTGVMQDLCARTEPLPTATYADRRLVAGPVDWVLDELPITGFTVTGTLSADGTQIVDATLEGTGDTRPLVPLLGEEDAGPEGVCELAASVGVNCTACPDGSGDFCIYAHAEGMVFDQVPLSVVAITEPASTCPEEEPAFCACGTTSWRAGSPILLAVAALIRRRRR